MMNKINVIILLTVFTVATVQASPFNTIGLRDGLNEIEMPGDGYCLFWSVAAGDNITSNLPLQHKLEEHAKRLRKQVVELYKTGSMDEELNTVVASEREIHKNKQEYIKAVAEHYWGGEVEILAMSRIFQKNIVHHMPRRKSITYPDGAPYNKTIHIWYNGSHYNLLTSNKS
jgi:hypothetical protein